MKRQRMLSSFFMPKRMAVEPEKHEMGWIRMVGKLEELVR